jgi:hypothetical protein
MPGEGRLGLLQAYASLATVWLHYAEPLAPSQYVQIYRQIRGLSVACYLGPDGVLEIALIKEDVAGTVRVLFKMRCASQRMINSCFSHRQLISYGTYLASAASRVGYIIFFWNLSTGVFEIGKLELRFFRGSHRELFFEELQRLLRVHAPDLPRYSRIDRTGFRFVDTFDPRQLELELGDSNRVTEEWTFAPMDGTAMPDRLQWARSPFSGIAGPSVVVYSGRGRNNSNPPNDSPPLDRNV